jgi:hypothetical protein
VIFIFHFVFLILHFELYYCFALPYRELHLKGDAMRISRRISFLFLLLVGTFLFTACPERQSISKILADPGRYRDKEVGITGTVTDAYGVLNTGAYEIDDGTGKIWVVTRRGVPSRGSRIGAKGRVYTGFNLGGRSFGTVLEESDRRIKD